MTVKLILALLVMSATTGPLAQSSAFAAPPLVDPNDPVYLARLASAGANGLETYDPLESVPGAPHVAPIPRSDNPTISAPALSAAVAYGETNNSKALLIWRDGTLEAEAYWRGADAASLLNAKSMAKPLGAIAIGRAIELGFIASLDQQAADFIPQWRGTSKQAITIRQLLNMTSGLAQQGPVKDPASIWSRAYLHPHHDRIIVEEYPLSETPGTVFQYANTSAELISVIIEAATHQRYSAFISKEILTPIAAAGGKVWVDRPGGLAHSGCCILLPAQTWLTLGLLLMDDGRWHGRRLLPEGYVLAMKTPSAQNPRYGLGIWLPGQYIHRRGFGKPDQMLGSVLHSEPYLATDLFLFDGNADQVLYMVPSKKLAILRMGDQPPKSPEWDNAYLPNLILRDLSH